MQAQLAELIRFRETCRAFMIAAEETGFAIPGGLFKPNNIYIDFGRAYYLENQHKMVNMLIDFCGRGVVIQPSKKELEHPYIGPKLAELMELVRDVHGTSVVLVEHDMQFVMDNCDQIVVLNLGAVLTSGTPTEIRNDPFVQAAYLGTSPTDVQPDPSTERRVVGDSSAPQVIP